MQAALSKHVIPAPDAATGNDRSGIVARPSELIALRHAARGLSIGKPIRVESALAGPHLSPFRGRGLDFEEVRSYQAGDDVRNIDWRVTARTGRVHSKVFHEERERPVWLLYDGGPTMHFGTRVCFKSVAAARAAALIAWSAQRAGDRLGAVVYSSASLSVWSPAARENHLLRVLGAISRATHAETGPVPPDLPPTTLRTALERLRERVRAGSRVFVVSDFYGFDASWQKPLSDLARRNQVDCLLVADRLEVEAPRPGRYRVSDGSNVRSIATSARSRSAFVRDFEDRRAGLSDFCRKRGVSLHDLRTDDDVASRVAAALRAAGPSARRRA